MSILFVNKSISYLWAPMCICADVMTDGNILQLTSIPVWRTEFATKLLLVINKWGLRHFSRIYKEYIYIYVYIYIYRVIRNDCWGFNRCYSPDHLVLQMQPRVISFYGFTSRIRFMFLLFPQVSRNWRYESEPPLKPSPLTCYKQYGTNSIIALMFVESQRVHIEHL